MSKYIPLEGAKVSVMNTKAVWAVGTAEPYQKTIDVMKALDNLTTIDIVRCKDCKHWDKYKAIDVGCCLRIDYDTSTNDYCSYGERKDNE